MKYIRLIFLSVLLLGTAFSSISAQDLKADLAKINQQYEGKRFAIGMQLEVYPSYKAQQTSQTFAGKYVKKGNDYYYQYGDFEMVHTDSLSLLVNHEREIIMIQAANTPETPDFRVKLDSLIQHTIDVNYQENGNQASYRFLFQEGPYPIIELVFNKTTWQIERLVHYYRAGAYHGVAGITEDDAVRTEMVYTSLTQDPQSASLLSENRFLKQEAGTYVLQPAFEKYELFNYLSFN